MDLVNIVNKDVWPEEARVNCSCMRCGENSVFESRFHLPVC
jgi:hypothetical protein